VVKSKLPYSYWTVEEIAILQKMYSASYQDELLNSLPKHTWTAIKTEAGKLKLYRKRNPFHHHHVNKTSFKKGIISWDKGLSKNTDKRVASMGNRKNHLPNKGSFKKNRVPWNKGLHWWTDEFRKWQSEFMKKLFAENPEIIRKIRKNEKPTAPERKLIDIISKYNLPYKYVGDGNFTVQHLNPDFVNINGKKKLIEIFGDYYHTTLATEWADTELGKIMIYNSFGFKCLVLWDHDMAKMTDNKIATLIRRFDRRR